MDFAKYLKDNGVSDMEFAKIVGSSRQCVWRWRRRICRPTFSMMRKIKQATGGAVDFSDWAFKLRVISVRHGK